MGQAERESGELGQALKALESQRERIDRLRKSVVSACGESETSPAVQSKPLSTGTPHPLDSNPDILKRRAIVRDNSEVPTPGICHLFDSYNVPLPSGPDWELYREQKPPWAKAYQKDRNLRKRIRVIISKDKKA